MRILFIMMLKLRVAVVLSTLWTSMLAAHELQPAIADLTITDGQAALRIDLNLEAYLSGINLDGLEDTDDAAEAEQYDRLRASEAPDLTAAVAALVARWNAFGILRGEGGAVVLNLAEATIPPVGDVETIRQSQLLLTAPFPEARFTFAWPDGAGEILLRQQGVEAPFTGYLTGGDTTPRLSVTGGNAKTGWGAFVEYIPVGFDHILPKGLDHILFVMGLFFLSTALGPLLWQITAFTAAHTITLALGALGYVTIPGSIVEPIIAASIVYVAVENIFARGLNPWRPVVIFGFGLLHGLGFASVLGDFGLPDGQFVPALLGFNLGVELGQLSVIAGLALLLWVSVKLAGLARLPAYEAAAEDYDVMFRAVSIPISLVIAGIGIWWVIERTLL